MMFNNERYVTRGVNATIDICTQNEIWNLIDTLRKYESVKLDNPQIFKLQRISQNSPNQIIIHSQKLASNNKQYFLTVDIPINAELYVIDNGDNTTIMLSDEC